MSRLSKWAICVGLALLVGAFGIHSRGGTQGANTAELNLQKRSDVLLRADFPWARVKMDGQKAYLTGEAPSQSARNQAVKALLAQRPVPISWVTGGVTAVDASNVTIAPKRDAYAWNAALGEDALTLSGAVPSELNKIAVEQLANALFPNHEIASDLSITRDPPVDDWMSRPLAGITALSHLKSGTAAVTNEWLDVTGLAGDDAALAAAREPLSALDLPTVDWSGIAVEAVSAAAEPAAAPLTAPEGEPATAEELAAAEPLAPAPTPAPSPTPSAEPEPEPDLLASAPPVPEEKTAEACLAWLTEVIDDYNITFSNGASALSDADAAFLARVAQAAVICPSARLTIAGHTDSTGSASLNVELSRARAENVLELLAEAGVSRTRLIAQGFGEAKPIATNQTVAGRRLNRRIEIRASL